MPFIASIVSLFSSPAKAAAELGAIFPICGASLFRPKFPMII